MDQKGDTVANRPGGTVERRWLGATGRGRICFIATVCSLLFVLVNWRNYANDCTPLALVPVALLTNGSLSLDSYRGYVESLPANQRYAFVESGGHLYPMKPVFTSLLVLPAFAPPILAGVPAGNVEFWIAWARLANAAVVGIATAFSYLIARRWTTERGALSVVFALTFGTGVWTVVAQSLNYHAGATLCVSAAFACLQAGPLAKRAAVVTGLLLGAAVGMRPTTVVLLAPLCAYLAFSSQSFVDRTSRVLWSIGIALVPLTNVAMNIAIFGDPLQTGYSADELNRWTTPILTGAFGLLFAPNAGLFVQSPVLLFLFAGRFLLRGQIIKREHAISIAGALGMSAYWLLFAKWYDWPGGLSFASRMLTEGYPLLLPPLALGWNRSRASRGGRALWNTLLCLSVLYQLVGVAVFDPVSVVNPPRDPWILREHYYAYFVRTHGLPLLLERTLLAGVSFVGCLVVAALICGSVFLPKDTGATRKTIV